MQAIKKAKSGMLIEGEHTNLVMLLDSVVAGLSESPTAALRG